MNEKLIITHEPDGTIGGVFWLPIIEIGEKMLVAGDATCGIMEFVRKRILVINDDEVLRHRLWQHRDWYRVVDGQLVELSLEERCKASTISWWDWPLLP